MKHVAGWLLLLRLASTVVEAAEPARPGSPGTNVIQLFNGTNLAGFST